MFDYMHWARGRLRSVRTQIHSRIGLPSLSTTREHLRDAWNDSLSPLWMCPIALLGIIYPWSYTLWATHRLSRHGSQDSGDLQALYALILLAGPMVCYFFKAFSLLGKWQRGKNTESALSNKLQVREDDTYEYVRGIPDRLLKTDHNLGLSEVEVHARQQAWGFNEPPRLQGWLELWLQEQTSKPYEICMTGITLHAIISGHWLHIGLTLMHCAISLRVGILSHKERESLWQGSTWSILEPAIVLRGGKISEVTTRDLVPGDIVYVRKGLPIPADALVISQDRDIRIGSTASEDIEARPDTRSEGSHCFIGEKVEGGDAFLLVLKTGVRTSNGSMAELPIRPPYLPLSYQSENKAFGYLIITFLAGVLALCTMLPGQTNSWLDYLGLVVSIAVITSAIQPSSSDALNAALNSAAMAGLGMVDNGAGNSVQLLAGIDLLCVDKLEIVTDSNRVVLEPWCYECNADDVVLGAVSTRHGRLEVHNSTDVALAKMLQLWPRIRANLSRQKMLDWQWDPELATIQSLIEFVDGERVLYIRGSAYNIRKKLHREQPNSHDAFRWLRKTARQNTRRGLDTIAIARRREGGQWELLGLLPMFDKPRFDSSFAVRLASELGISIKMFSSEAKAVTEATARRIGLHGDVLTASKALSTDKDSLATTDAIAECSLEDQSRIILKAREKYCHRVAAVAEDAHLLETIECGISASNAAERLGTAADVRLLQNGLAVVVNGIRVARHRFQWMYCHLSQAVQCSLALILILSWHFVAQREVIDLRIWLLGQSVTSVGFFVGNILLELPEIETEFSKKPMTWTSRSPLREAMPAVLVTTLGHFAMRIVLRKTEVSSTPNEFLAATSQGLCLHVLIVEHGTRVLVKTGVIFWNKRLARMRLAAYAGWLLLVTAECATGWFVAESPLRLRTCAWVWAISITTLAALWLLRLLVPRGPHMTHEDLLSIWPKYRSGPDHL